MENELWNVEEHKSVGGKDSVVKVHMYGAQKPLAKWMKEMLEDNPLYGQSKFELKRHVTIDMLIKARLAKREGNQFQLDLEQ